MNETLKKEICARLPYGVKIDTTRMYNGYDIMTLCDKGGLSNIGIYDLIDYIDFCKPILFPISCLTKEITVNGETFVPIEEILSLRGFMTWTKTNNVDEPNNFIIEIEDGCDNYITLDFTDYLDLPVFIIELLQKWHINYRLAPNEFIEATNEY